MQPQFETYQHGLGSTLRCPSCDYDYLHHDKIVVFDRGEYEKKTTQSPSGYPSHRRDGLCVKFWCEGCEARPVLYLSQHKGNTYIDIK